MFRLRKYFGHIDKFKIIVIVILLLLYYYLDEGKFKNIKPMRSGNSGSRNIVRVYVRCDENEFTHVPPHHLHTLSHVERRFDVKCVCACNYKCDGIEYIHILVIARCSMDAKWKLCFVVSSDWLIIIMRLGSLVRQTANQPHRQDSIIAKRILQNRMGWATAATLHAHCGNCIPFIYFCCIFLYSLLFVFLYLHTKKHQMCTGTKLTCLKLLFVFHFDVDAIVHNWDRHSEMARQKEAENVYMACLSKHLTTTTPLRAIK